MLLCLRLRNSVSTTEQNIVHTCLGSNHLIPRAKHSKACKAKTVSSAYRSQGFSSSGLIITTGKIKLRKITQEILSQCLLNQAKSWMALSGRRVKSYVIFKKIHPPNPAFTLTIAASDTG